MPSVYLTNVTGDGVSTFTAHRPDIPAASFACLMIDETSGRALIVSPDNSLSGSGVLLLASGATWEEMEASTRQTKPNPPKLSQINTWLTSSGYQPVTSDMTWNEIVHFIARQVNPAADLATTRVA
jgi:hypothetical protein